MKTIQTVLVGKPAMYSIKEDFKTSNLCSYKNWILWAPCEKLIVTNHSVWECDMY